LYSTNIIREIKRKTMRWAGNVARMCEKRNTRTYRVWWEKTVGKRQLGRLRRRREDNVRMDAKVTVGLWKGMNWIDLAQDRTSAGLL